MQGSLKFMKIVKLALAVSLIMLASFIFVTTPVSRATQETISGKF
jgi:hypothetical protein